MKIKRYLAKNIRRALEIAREEQGPDVVILSSRKTLDGVELITENHETEKKIAAKTHATQLKGQQGSWLSDAVISEMQGELKSLRGLLEWQMSSLAWDAMGRQHPLWANLLRQLGRLGLSPQIAQRLVESIPGQGCFEHAWHKILELLSYWIPVQEGNFPVRNKPILFIGPSGSGKTTTIAKLATQSILQQSEKQVLLATTDTYRAGGREQLRSYARILDIPMCTIASEQDLSTLFESAARDQLILFDTAGLSNRNSQHQEQLNLLRMTKEKCEVCLVIPATEQYPTLQKQMLQFQSISPNYCIATKLDEATTLGAIISYVIEHYLPIASVCDGQNITEDIHTISVHSLVKQMTNLGQHQADPDEKKLEKNTGQRLYKNRERQHEQKNTR